MEVSNYLKSSSPILYVDFVVRFLMYGCWIDIACINDSHKHSYKNIQLLLKTMKDCTITEK